MLLHYEFMLPPSFDMDAIRRRIEEKRHLFDHHPGLVWKAWLLADGARQPGQANGYAPLYLFEDAGALRDFLLGPLYAGVTQTFGWVQPASGPLLGAAAPALHAARSCSLAVSPVRSHAGLLAQAERRPPAASGLLGHTTMFDVGRMQLRQYTFWACDAAELPAAAEGGRVYEVGAVSAPASVPASLPVANAARVPA